MLSWRLAPQEGECKMSTDTRIALVSTTLAIVTLIITSIYRYLEIKEKRNSERRIVIERTLNEFYGPLISYLNVVKALYEIFRATKPQGFRTLTYLLDPDQVYQVEGKKEKVILSPADTKLLEEIIETEKSIEDLILTKSGLVDDEQLMFNYVPDPAVTDVKLSNMSLIAVALAHFRLLRMAYAGHFKGEVARFTNLVYPREFDIQLRARVEKLQMELARL
jgi:hypothetical protein